VKSYFAHIREDGTSQSIKDHLQGAAILASRFATIFNAIEFANAVALSHDLGKYSDAFQQRLSGANIQVDHSTAGGQYIVSRENNALAKIAAYCIMGHHGGLPDGGSDSSNTCDEPTLAGRLKRIVPDYSAFEEDGMDIPDLAVPSIRLTDGFSLSFFTRMIFSCLVDADWLDTEAFMNDGARPRGGFDSLPTLHKKMKKEIEPFLNPSGDTSELNTMRTLLLKDCLDAAKRAPGLFTLTAPTGSGKTISSMSFALAHANENKNGMNRVIYVIPYNTIIEQNAKVFETLLGEENVLQHHSGIYYTADENSPDYRKLLATENWDAPIVVTSSVRFFESFYANRPSACRKLHNVANSVIVLDEAQMIPLPHLLPCIAVLKELVTNYGCSVVLATATQSSLNEFFDPIEPFEIVHEPKKMYAFFRRVTYEVIKDALSDEDIAQRIGSHEQALCVVATRKRAQIVAGLIGEGTFHLSTTMYPQHRSRVLSEIRHCLESGAPCRVVSTSMIEAGVDVDFPIVYREEAGLDSVIQAAGRCNREGKRPVQQSKVYIFSTLGGVPKGIEQNVAAYEYAVRNHEDIASLESIKAYFEQLRYFIGAEGLDKGSIVQDFNGGIKAGMSFPFKTVAQAFRLIDQNTKNIIVPVEEEAIALIDRIRQGERSREVFRAIQKYSVSLYDTDLKNLLGVGAVESIDEEIHILSAQYYSEQYGVELAPTGGFAIFG